MRYLPFLIFLTFLFTDCSEESTNLPADLKGIDNLTVYPSDIEPLSSIQLNRQQSFGDSGDLTIGQISGIAVDDSGRVFLAEATEGHAAIYLFTSDSKYIKSLGGYGKGPSEFRSIINPQVVNGNLFALSGLQLQINSYSVETLKYHDTINLDPRNWSQIEQLNGASPADFIPLNNGNFIIIFLKSEGPKDLFYHYLMDRSGDIISDKILEQKAAEHFIEPDQQSVFYSPYSGKGLVAVSADDHIYSIWTENIFIKEHDMEGNYQHSFYHPFNNRKLDRDEVLNLYDNESYQKAVQNTGIPESMPAVNSMVLDDENGIWISTITEDQDQYEWWILSRSGELIATFIWPQNRDIKIIRNRSVFALETDTETGLQTVVKYNVRMDQ